MPRPRTKSYARSDLADQTPKVRNDQKYLDEKNHDHEPDYVRHPPTDTFSRASSLTHVSAKISREFAKQQRHVHQITVAETWSGELTPCRTNWFYGFN